MNLKSRASHALHGAFHAAGYDLTKRDLATGFPRICPICGFEGHFLDQGYNVRVDSECPRCHSLERHRLFALWLRDHRALLADKRILHFAPEASVRSLVKDVSPHYRTADLFERDVDFKEDIENLSFADESYDAIICFHVLEHVDDEKAIAEFRRILAPDGVALIAVPIVEGWDVTYEDPAVVSGNGRRLHFGQHDHLRMYGRDFRDRLTAGGLDVEEHVAAGAECVRYGLLPGERLFIARVHEADRQPV